MITTCSALTVVILNDDSITYLYLTAKNKAYHTFTFQHYQLQKYIGSVK